MSYRFSNQWYPILLIICIMTSLAIRVKGVVLGLDWISILHVFLLAVLIFCLLFYKEYAKLSVKLWSGIAVLGGMLGLISVSMLVVIGRIESLDIVALGIHLLHLIVGIILYRYWDSSISYHEA